MFKSILILLFVLTYPISFYTEAKRQLIIWDVGQGQWATLVYMNSCYHFDVGGEKAPWADIQKKCGFKKNYVSFSHWDLDHINLSRKAYYRLKNLCILHLPGGPKNIFKHNKYLKPIPLCRSKTLWVTEVKFNKFNKKLSSNSHSRIFILNNKILIPGDSTQKEEKNWAPNLKNTLIKYLILGHHGSRFSNSAKLLQNLKNLKMSFASSRTKRYGHPHINTVNRLKLIGTPVVSTQDWGNIILNLGK